MTAKAIWVFVLAALLGLLAGCQESESTRAVSGEKGIYSGKADEALSDDARQQLRRRMFIQRGGGL